jgi:hypothetical protein
MLGWLVGVGARGWNVGGWRSEDGVIDLLSMTGAVMCVIAAVIGLAAGVFWLGLYLYFHAWLRSLKEPGGPA